MANDNRPSLSRNLDGRLHTQKAGSTFDVKDTLLNPHTSVPAGRIIDSTSANGQEFQNPNGFETRVPIMVTRMKDAQGNSSKQLSKYSKGLDNRRYGNAKPFHQF